MKVIRGVFLFCGLMLIAMAVFMMLFRTEDGELYWLMSPVTTNISENSILRLNPDGSEIIEIPYEIEQFWTAVWSPDGQYVAYVSGIFYDLYTMRYDGTEVTKVFGCFGPVQSPTWSPDSNQLAFVANCRQQGLSLFTMNFDRDHIRSNSLEGMIVTQKLGADGQIVESEQIVATYEDGELHRLTDTRGTENTPVWSPNGEWIAFQSQRDGRNNIFRIRPDGTDMQQLSHERNAWRPVWSPDGEWIAYQTIHDARSLAIKRIHAETGEVQVITTEQSQNPPANYWSPWSPDGEWLVFSSTRDDDQEIYKVRADGTDLQRLTNNIGFDGQPVWSPDGQWIAFLSVRDQAFEIYRMRPDGTDVQRLTENNAFEQLPMWSPLIDKPHRLEAIFALGLLLALCPLVIEFTFARFKAQMMPQQSGEVLPRSYSTLQSPSI